MNKKSLIFLILLFILEFILLEYIFGFFRNPYGVCTLDKCYYP